MIVEPYRAEHLERLALQPKQEFLSAVILGSDRARALEHSDAYAMLSGNRVLACLGVLTMDQGRGLAWGVVAENAGPHFVAITRKTQDYFRHSPLRRIEAHIEHTFAEAHRWAVLLGFRDETPEGMREFRAGETYHLYARVKNG